MLGLIQSNSVAKIKILFFNIRMANSEECLLKPAQNIIAFYQTDRTNDTFLFCFCFYNKNLSSNRLKERPYQSFIKFEQNKTIKIIHDRHKTNPFTIINKIF